MALRSSWAYTVLTDGDYDSRARMKATGFDQILENQEDIIRRPEFIVGDTFYPVSTTSTSYVTLYRAFVRVDRCGLKTSGLTATAWIYAADIVAPTSNGSGNVGVLSDYDSVRQSGAMTKKDFAWVQCTSGTLTVDGDGAETVLQIQAKRTTGTAYVGGFAIVSSATFS